eukprot:scaffold103585_cov19-Tisochrysis_lutea.AAC.1
MRWCLSQMSTQLSTQLSTQINADSDEHTGEHMLKGEAGYRRTKAHSSHPSLRTHWYTPAPNNDRGSCSTLLLAGSHSSPYPQPRAEHQSIMLTLKQSTCTRAVVYIASLHKGSTPELQADCLLRLLQGAHAVDEVESCRQAQQKAHTVRAWVHACMRTCVQECVSVCVCARAHVWCLHPMGDQGSRANQERQA